MVLADSHGISRVPRYSGTCPPSQFDFVYRTVTFCGSTFQRASTIDLVDHSAALRPDRPYNPREHAPWFGLFRVRSPLLAESLTCFLFLRVLRWFTSPRCLPHPMDSDADTPVQPRVGFPIRKSPDQSLLAAPRGLSQLATSFIDC